MSVKAELNKGMTVAELVMILEELEPSAVVCVAFPNPNGSTPTRVVDEVLSVHSEDLYGVTPSGFRLYHEDERTDEPTSDTTIPVVVLM